MKCEFNEQHPSILCNPLLLFLQIFTINDQENLMLTFLETADPELEEKILPPFDEKTQVLLFFKYYNPRTKVMAYCGHLYVPMNQVPSK